MIVDDYDQYFPPGSEPPKSRRPRRRRAPPGAVTGTTGSPVKATPEALARALNRAYDVQGDSGRDYALVFMQSRQAGIVREGRTVASATFTVFANGQILGTYRGAAGRDRAIKALLGE